MSGVIIDKKIADGVAILTLDNPPLNLVTRDMTQALDSGLSDLAADTEVRVLVVRGAGERAFCAGSDISEFPTYIEAGNVVEKKLRYENEIYSKLDDFPKPTIAAVDGLAYGGGLEMAACCDLIVVEEDARLCLPEIHLGVFPGSGGSIRITRRIGEGRAKEIIFFGNPIDPATALAWGLVNRVVAPGTAVASAVDWARDMATRPGLALQACKKAVDLAFDMSEDEAIKRTLDISTEIFATDDCKEGVRAFFAKDTPHFRHR